MLVLKEGLSKRCPIVALCFLSRLSALSLLSRRDVLGNRGKGKCRCAGANRVISYLIDGESLRDHARHITGIRWQQDGIALLGQLAEGFHVLLSDHERHSVACLASL